MTAAKEKIILCSPKPDPWLIQSSLIDLRVVLYGDALCESLWDLLLLANLQKKYGKKVKLKHVSSKAAKHHTLNKAE